MASETQKKKSTRKTPAAKGKSAKGTGAEGNGAEVNGTSAEQREELLHQQDLVKLGLAGNLGRSPRTWLKPDVGVETPPHATYARSDDFSTDALKPVWQWNHQPVDGKWSLVERPGALRLQVDIDPYSFL